MKTASTPWAKLWGLSLKRKGKIKFSFKTEKDTPFHTLLMLKPFYIYFYKYGNLVHKEKVYPWWHPEGKLYVKPENSYTTVVESFEEL